MAKGQKSKEAVIEKILSSFEGAFLYNGNKEIRIPRTDDGELVQIKVSLTCAKENVEPGDDTVVPGATSVKATKATIAEGAEPVFEDVSGYVSAVIEPSAEELNAVNSLMESLGL